MDMSETILAAMIGASATTATALFQIFSSFRARSKTDYRPNSRSMLRTILSVLALMAASGVGGYLYAELRAEDTRQDLRQMREDFTAQLQAVASATARIDNRLQAAVAPAASPNSPTAIEQVESVVHVPPCRTQVVTAESVPSACSEADAQRVSLCATLPSNTSIRDVLLFSRGEGTSQNWDSYRVNFDQETDGARFVDKPYEQAVGADHKTVCVNYVHLSSERAHLARLVVQFAPA
ncbi:MAG: hypothetical protein H7Y02_13355 [Candidatus Obscuribacterales bacterium]|nr:hypothetical protein [Steroidobacteraceae bacterium]